MTDRAQPTASRPRHMWGRLLVLLVPVTILGVWLKLVRIRAFYPGSSLFDVAAKTSSDGG